MSEKETPTEEEIKAKKFAAFRELVNSALMSGWFTAHNFNCTNALGRQLTQQEMDHLEVPGTQAVLLHFINFLKDPRGKILMEALDVELPDEIDVYIQKLIEESTADATAAAEAQAAESKEEPKEKEETKTE